MYFFKTELNYLSNIKLKVNEMKGILMSPMFLLQHTNYTYLSNKVHLSNII